MKANTVNDNFDEVNISTLETPMELPQNQTYTMLERSLGACKVEPSVKAMKKTVKSLLD